MAMPLLAANDLEPVANLPAVIEPAPYDNLPDLLQMYTAAEEASSTARTHSERDRDYVDNKQLTDAEVATLKKRGQPPIVLNVIRSRAAFLAGMEKRQRRDPKAWPRNNPNDVQAAEAFSDGMRYCVDKADYASIRSQAWKNITVEGFGGIEIAAVPKANGDIEITLKRMPWDRMFYDPHSSEPDFTDARYKGCVLWMDLDEAMARAVAAGADPERVKNILETTLESGAGFGKTYDDKPSWTVWGDRKRKRVRVVQIWHREPSGWKYCEFTKGGKLLESDGPYVDQDGETYCPWVWESANVDRDNNRYGEIRHLIDPQDEINKRRSKALHLLNVKGVIADEGAVEDVNKARRELARPDFWITKQPGSDFKIETGGELAAGQAMLGAQALAYIAEAGPNQALLGKGTQDQSGRAIEAQQAGGLVEQSDLMDTLRRMDLRVFTIIASMIKQYWTAEKWIRVTDDEDAPKWVGLNTPMWTDPETGMSASEEQWRDLETKLQAQGRELPQLIPAVDPETGQPRLANNVAELDMDIIVSDAPDSITLDGENYQAFMQLMASGLPPAQLKFAIEMHPGLPSKRKKQLSEMLDQMGKPGEKPPEQADVERLAREKIEADIGLIRANTYDKLVSGETKMAKAYLPPMPMPDVAAALTDEAPQPMAPQGPQGGPTGAPPMPPGMEGPPQPEGPPSPQMPPPGPQGPPRGGPLAGMMTGAM
jgi:hypothetical protein